MFEDYRKGTIVDYKKNVWEFYLKRKNEQNLPSDLEAPTPSQLRDYSLYILANKSAKEDEQLLKSFFDRENKHADLESAIQRFDLDKFKPLIKFLNRKSITTSDKNIKLLAWLINFESYETWKKNRREIGETVVEREPSTQDNGDSDHPLPEKDVEESGEDERSEGTFPEVETNQRVLPAEEQNKGDEQIPSGGEKALLTAPQAGKNSAPLSPTPTYKRRVLYAVIASVTAIGIYLFATRQNPGCMFWSGDHYQPVSCKEKIQDVAIIALDENKVDRFSKITRPDTLTEQALGKVWYVKMTVDSLEFYTASGFHPIYTTKKLKPLTEYILERHIQNKQSADSLGK